MDGRARKRVEELRQHMERLVTPHRMCDSGLFGTFGIFGVFGRGRGLVNGGARPGMVGMDWAVGTEGSEGAVVQKQLRENTKNPARSFNHRYLFR